MRSATCRRAVMFGVALVVIAASLLAAYVLATSAPATTRQSAPIWFSTADTTRAGRNLTVYGGIDVKTNLSGAVIKLYKREVGTNASTYVGKATVTYNAMTGNVFQGVMSRLQRSCVVTARWAGNARYFAARTWMFAGVSPRLTVTTPILTQHETKVRIDFSPAQPLHRQGMTRPPFLASVQCRVADVWTDFPGELGVLSTDGKSWCVYEYFNMPTGTYTIRANFAGTNYNVASVSKTTEIVVP
jgi:hypothetical protein